MKYNIHLNVYDGPLDLLCDLISKQKIDIKDISILEITSQYLAYIDMLNEKTIDDIFSKFNEKINKTKQLRIIEIEYTEGSYGKEYDSIIFDKSRSCLDVLNEYKDKYGDVSKKISKVINIDEKHEKTELELALEA